MKFFHFLRPSPRGLSKLALCAAALPLLAIALPAFGTALVFAAADGVTDTNRIWIDLLTDPAIWLVLGIFGLPIVAALVVIVGSSLLSRRLLRHGRSRWGVALVAGPATLFWALLP